MRRLCPTISELNAFHAAAKHGSFTAAADALCVTQGAVSRHIQSLERYLNQALFVRQPRGLTLTEAGASYLRQTLPALAALESATAQLLSHGGAGGALDLSVPPTFATQWLFPRLGDFKRALPQITLNFVRYQHAHDFSEPPAFDAAIQFGHGNWPGANAIYLIGREVSVACSPALRESLALAQPADLARATLLHHLDVPLAWPEWLQARGCHLPSARMGPSFNQYSLMIRAAEAGFGVAILPACLIEDELALGRLVEPFAGRHHGRAGYFLCAPQARTHLSAYKQVRDWLNHCCAHTLAQGQAPEADCVFCQS